MIWLVWNNLNHITEGQSKKEKEQERERGKEKERERMLCH